jgi:hypothetical protein
MMAKCSEMNDRMPRALAVVLALLVAGYVFVLLLAASETIPPGAIFPDIKLLDRAVFGARARPTSAVERLLEAEDGEMNAGGTMRPAFTTESTDWEATTKELSRTDLSWLLAEREGERLALLDWVKAGADRTAYYKDDHRLSPPLANQAVTREYLVNPADRSPNQLAEPRIKVRSLVQDRCVPCHSEGGRNDKARFFPFDSYENLHPFCRPEQPPTRSSFWLTLALGAQCPLAILTGVLAARTRQPAARTWGLSAITAGSALATSASWWFGQPGTWAIYVLVLATASFFLAFTVQAVGFTQLWPGRAENIK